MKFEIHISTKNRIADLKVTLSEIQILIERPDVTCVIFDDGSSDGTHNFVKSNYPAIRLFRNEISKGYIYCRNQMLNRSKAEYAISLDDDAHFLVNNPLEQIAEYFENNAQCGVMAFRIMWSKTAPQKFETDEKPQRVKSFVGCGHAWRISAWNTIPDYPEWFGFYGEELFASFYLYMNNIEVHYIPQILILHRVDMKIRKSNADFKSRYYNLLKSDWYLYFIFIPLTAIPKKMAYSIWMQLKKIVNGQPELIVPFCRSIISLVLLLPKLFTERKALSVTQYQGYHQLNPPKIYWKP